MVGAENKLPLVAVVTPVYNGSPYLEHTLACIQAQTYSNIVHVVLDNASTDETPDIINRYEDGRVPILTRRNRETFPLQRNWETAVRLTPQQADYFIVLCADDLITADAIEKLVLVAELDPTIGVVGCRWTTGPSLDCVSDHSRCGLPKERSIFDGRWFVKAYLIQLQFATSPQCQLFRRCILDDAVPFYAHGEMLMDIDACLRTLMRWKYGFVHSALGFTRLHSGRVTDRIMNPHEMFTANWFDLIERYGPRVMTRRDFQKCRRIFLHHYFRRMLLWRFRDRNRALFDSHRAFLTERGARPALSDYAEALLEWVWLALRNRRNEVARARSLWASTWAELPASSQWEQRPCSAKYEHPR